MDVNDDQPTNTESIRAQKLDEALSDIHQRAHLAFQRTGIFALQQIAEIAWAALIAEDDRA